jgi:phage baseplate assembly protein W
MSTGYCAELPLIRTIEDGHYKLKKTIAGEIKQNFKILLLTMPGERVMDSNFGIGIQRYLFEQNMQPTWADIDTRIRNQTKTYIPAIRINSIKFITTENARDVNENYLGIRIDFTIVPLKIRSTFEIPRGAGGISVIENPNWGYVTSI